MASLTWSGQNVVGEFKLGAVPLEMTGSSHLVEEYKTIVYTKQESRFCQIAVKSTHEVSQLHTGELLYRIPDTDVWIIKQDWRKGQTGKHYHYCPSVNTVGIIYLEVAGITVVIEVGNSIPDFDFDQLKDDFTGEFWHLLTSARSDVHTTKQTGQARLPISELVRLFLHSFQQIAKSPKTELKETVRLRPIHEVKPIAKTYQKLAANGLNTTVLLPSKAYTENIDLYENQYVCQMLSEIVKIAHHTEVYHEQRIKSLNSYCSNAKEAINNLDKPEILDPVEIEEELNMKRDLVQALESKWESINRTACNPLKYTPKYLTINILYADRSDESSFYCSFDGVFCQIIFPSLVASHLRINSSYKFAICLREISEKVGSRGPYKVYNAYSIVNFISLEVEKARQLLNTAISNHSILEKNGWQADSIQSSYEKNKNATDRLVQKKTLQEKIKKINDEIETYRNALENSAHIHEKLQKVCRSGYVQQVNKQKSIKFRPSMTFIQNAHYKNAYQTYLKIKETVGIDSDTLDLFGKLEDYTIRELPQIYELWCLVSTMRILEDFFGFKPNQKDIIKLLTGILPSEKKIERLAKIVFSGELAGRTVNLYYQKRYKSSLKRPDMLLEIRHSDRVIYLILDAKCKNYNSLVAAESDMHEMVWKYREDQKNRFVFTVHPRFGRSQKNAELTNIGGKAVYVTGVPTYPFHEFGYFAAQPGRTDNLRKAISMGFEYLLEANHNANKGDSIDPKPDYDFICMNCGGVDFKITQAKREGKPPNPRPKYTYEYKCNNLTCGHSVSINYCWNCKTKLFKHGRYWDYHRTSVYSAMDIHCPSCGMTTADLERQNNYA